MNKLYNVITSYCVNTLHSHWKTRAPCSLESFNQGFYRGNKGYFYPIALQSHSCFLHFSSPRSHCFNYPSPFPVNRPSLYSTVPPFLLFPLSVYITLPSIPRFHLFFSFPYQCISTFPLFHLYLIFDLPSGLRKMVKMKSA